MTPSILRLHSTYMVAALATGPWTEWPSGNTSSSSFPTTTLEMTMPPGCYDEEELRAVLYADEMRRRDLSYLVPPNPRRLRCRVAATHVLFFPPARSYRHDRQTQKRTVARGFRGRMARRARLCGAGGAHHQLRHLATCNAGIVALRKVRGLRRKRRLRAPQRA